ncbi:hypothetical protein ACN28G_28535 [Micromonospora sp. WMMA1923]|uniref:hypothetical protein n=1 Tax=Micromonospora sp. WMMA1923 TaxID=3404125 RepID=UPI003B964C79
MVRQPVDPAQIPLPPSRDSSPAVSRQPSPAVSPQSSPAVSRQPSPPPYPGHRPPGSPESGGYEPVRRSYLDGDLAKSIGAAVALAVPGVGIANVAGQGQQLATAGVGVSIATAIGDAASEVVKYLQEGRINVPKLLGGVLTSGGLLVNVGGMANRVDPTRYAGMGVQDVGLVLKGIGEGYRWEDGTPALTRTPSGDIAKMVGAFVTTAAPVLQAVALRTQRQLEQRSLDTGGTGTAGPIPTAVAAALFAGGTAAGEFASEVVRGVQGKGVNVPKLMGGLFSAVGAATIAGGVATANPVARYAGLSLQAVGLAAKSVGEARRWENTSTPSSWYGHTTPAKHHAATLSRRVSPPGR